MIEALKMGTMEYESYLAKMIKIESLAFLKARENIPSMEYADLIQELRDFFSKKIAAIIDTDWDVVLTDREDVKLSQKAIAQEIDASLYNLYH